MNIIAIGKNERIEYRNVSQLKDQGDCFYMYSNTVDPIEVIVNFHTIANSDHIIIEKRCFICNEVYID